VDENDINNLTKYNTNDDGLLIENDSDQNYKTTKYNAVESLVKKSLDRAAVEKLKAWLYEHRFNPYPLEHEKEELAKRTGLTIRQVFNWFLNARRRFLPAVLKEEGLVLKGDASKQKSTKTVHKMNANQSELSEKEIKTLSAKKI